MKSSDILKVKLHPEGHPYIALFFVVALVLGFISTSLGWLGFLLTLWCAYFFRDPERVVPPAEGLLVSPADGVVSAVSEVSPPPELEMKDDRVQRVSIFLSVFNVHINRLPEAGVIRALAYRPGTYLDAADDRASEENERQLIQLETPQGAHIGVVQVAGLVARRIRCTLAVGQEVTRGERFGLIRFGSRVDLYIPASYRVIAAVGQTMIGGETAVAERRLQPAGPA